MSKVSNIKNSHNGVLGGLNAEQRQAVTATKGPVLVLSGAGTGKTRVITFRIAHLISKGIRPENILAVTFTRRAAREMSDRVAEVLGSDARGLSMATFHSLGFRILREHVGRTGLKRGVKICNSEERIELVEWILNGLANCESEEAVSERTLDARRVLLRIAQAKSQGQTPEMLGEASKTDADRLVYEVYRRYQQTLRDSNQIDFDDMVLLPLQLLKQSAATRRGYQTLWRYIMVDEYQDTNSAQNQLTRCLLGPTKNLCVVGDDDQAIYGFRGAEPEKILSFERDFPGGRVIKLELNYRSRSPILELANAVIEKASQRYPKRLRSHLGVGEPVSWRPATDEEDEAEYIAEKVLRLERSEDTRFRDIAILVRTHKAAKPLQRAFRNRAIPYTRAENRKANPADRVCLMTLHQSKGLEWPVVFLPALEDDSLPHYHAVRDGKQSVEEERRLFYVGITRAKRALFLSSAMRRAGYARTKSRFLHRVAGSFLVTD